VDDVASDSGEFERWFAQNLKANPTACAVIGIALGHQGRVRSAFQVGVRRCIQPMQVRVSVPEFLNDPGERMVSHG
jgi:hypothetical protein